jgi:hypothetical protein
MGIDDALDFNSLVEAITRIHAELAARATRAVNISLTLRNWFIGYYIREYELGGSDRAAYGEKLLESLSLKLAERGMKRVDTRELRRFRQFYLTYPQIREALTPELVKNISRCSIRPKEAEFGDSSRSVESYIRDLKG